MRVAARPRRRMAREPTDAGAQTDAGGSSPPAPHICGPDIDRSLTNVLVKIQTDFAHADVWDKRTACENLHIPPMAIMAWDINDLFLQNTSWINSSSPGCATPLVSGEVENASGCTNSVWAGGNCHLAGTANYAMFGIVQKLCNDFREIDSWWWQPMANMYSEDATRDLIGLYKAIDPFDTSDRPIDWAVTTYRGGPTARPTTGNRSGCSRCGGGPTTRVFDYSWWPIHGRLWSHP